MIDGNKKGGHRETFYSNSFVDVCLYIVVMYHWGARGWSLAPVDAVIAI